MAGLFYSIHITSIIVSIPLLPQRKRSACYQALLTHTHTQTHTSFQLGLSKLLRSFDGPGGAFNEKGQLAAQASSFYFSSALKTSFGASSK